MSSYAINPYPNFIGTPAQHVLFGGMIENMDGSKMFVAKYEPIETKEDEVSNNNRTYLQELLHALKLSWPLLVLIIISVFGFFQLTQSRIDAQMSEVRTQMASDRKAASDDNAALRSDINQGFNRVADKLDDTNKTLSKIQVDQATQKAQLEQKK